MWFLPYKKVTLRTYLSSEEVYQRLSELVEPRKWIRFSRQHKPFQGTMTPQTFSISRIIHYRNSFLPYLKGEIRNDLDKTAVDITFAPHPAILVIIPVAAFLMFVGALIGALDDGAGTGLPMLAVCVVPLIFITLLWVVSTPFFHYEVKQALKVIEESVPTNTL